MMKFAKALLLLALLAAAFFSGYVYKSRSGEGPAPGKGGRKILYYIDPMHPSYKSDKPGVAPDCGMKLEPVYEDGSGPAQPRGRILYYRDPQDPRYKSDKPGLNPETGNELEPVYEGDASTMPVGTVQISPEKQQLIGVRYGTVEILGGSRQIRAVGKVTYDETRLSHVHTKVEGWIEKVFVDFTGQEVKKGQPLLTIYSPELVATQGELLLAAKARRLMKNNVLDGAFEQSESLLEAARRRLELWDITDEQIDRVLETGQPIRAVTLYAHTGGYVLQRNAFPHQKVTPDTDLYTLADLSRVWIVADVFESEAPVLRLGQPARVTLSYLPGRAFAARVTYIQPQVDPMTRTLKIRLEADNPGLALKPEMYADVEFHISLPPRLSVPVSAVLDAGERQTVFVDRGNGFLEPRRVETGERVGDRVVILKGLKAGERVVTSGNFLIDSESQLKAAAAGMGGMEGHQHRTGEMPSGQDQRSKPAAPRQSPELARPPAGSHQHD